LSNKIYTTERPIGKEHDVHLDKELHVANRDTGFVHFVDLTKELYEVDALRAFFLLTESGNFLTLEQGGRLVNFYG
jgi:hypothetical protein